MLIHLLRIKLLTGFVLHHYVITLCMLQRVIIIEVILLEYVPFAKTNILKYSFCNRIISS